MMSITMIQKIKADGTLCRKSAKVLHLLQQLGVVDRINQIVTADDRNPLSAGFQWAQLYRVETAPFFVVFHDQGEPQVYTAYTRFFKEVLHQSVPEEEEMTELMAQNPELDFI